MWLNITLHYTTQLATDNVTKMPKEIHDLNGLDQIPILSFTNPEGALL